jgi:hypothetical protein
VRLRRRPDLLASFYALAGGALVVPRARAVLMVEDVFLTLPIFYAAYSLCPPHTTAKRRDRSCS